MNDRFDSTYRLSYSKTEICDSVQAIEHPIFRAVLKNQAPSERGLELISMADIPSGTGLGSSSSFTVALVHALKAHLGQAQKPEDLASEACRIEIEELKEPIGKQDQYAAAYGGLQYIRFLPNGSVIADPVICSAQTVTQLQASVVLFFTGFSRQASTILTEQKSNTAQKRTVLRAMKEGAASFKRVLESGEDLRAAGELLHQGWELKRGLATGISSGQIDDWYARGLKAGAWGGKILGAGGGGFLMFLCDPEKQAALKAELKELRPVPVQFEPLGSRILFVG